MSPIGDIFLPRDSSYWGRMVLIQRWGRIAWLVCLFLTLWGALFSLLDSAAQSPSVAVLIKSMFAFIIAIAVAVNFFTFRLR